MISPSFSDAWNYKPPFSQIDIWEARGHRSAALVAQAVMAYEEINVAQPFRAACGATSGRRSIFTGLKAVCAESSERFLRSDYV